MRLKFSDIANATEIIHWTEISAETPVPIQGAISIAFPHVLSTLISSFVPQNSLNEIAKLDGASYYYENNRFLSFYEVTVRKSDLKIK